MAKTPNTRTHRLLLDQVKEPGQVIDLPADLMHYTSRVLRLLDGTQIEVWNGRGEVFPAEIRYLSKKEAQVTVTGQAIALAGTELKRNIWIAQGLPESDKMDWVLSKCTEMGAAGFLPIQAERSVVKLNEDRAQKRHTHWLKVLASSGLQSERECMPTLAKVKSLNTALEEWSQWSTAPSILLFTPSAEQRLSEWIAQEQDNNQTPVIVMVGPEGGWSPEEHKLAQNFGALPLRLGNRILRTETFGLACLSQLIGGLALEP